MKGNKQRTKICGQKQSKSLKNVREKGNINGEKISRVI